MDNYIFNRVLGLKFLYDNFPYYFNKNRLIYKIKTHTKEGCTVVKWGGMKSR